MGIRDTLRRFVKPDATPQIKVLPFEAMFPAYGSTHLTVTRLEDTPAGVRPLELLYLSYLAGHWPATRVFEFGTSLGRTTLNLALNVPADGHVYSLDLPNGLLPPSHLFMPGQETEILELDKGSYLADVEHPLPITLLKGESTTFDFAPWIGTMDLIFVDGGHSWDVLDADTGNALRMLRDGGVIVWHDYLHHSCPDVFRYLNRLALKMPLVHVKGTKSVVFIKDEAVQKAWRTESTSRLANT